MAILLILSVHPVKVSTRKVSALPPIIEPKSQVRVEQAEKVCDKLKRLELRQKKARRVLVRALESRGLR